MRFREANGRCFFDVNGHDLMMILSARARLDELFRRRFAEEGLMFVPFGELFKRLRKN
jgi:hypothetical protein